MPSDKKQANIAHGISRVALARNYGTVEARLDAKSKSILVCLASRCSDATPSKTFVSVETLAYETSWSEPTVTRALKQLVGLGLISRQLRANGYRSSRNTTLNWPLIVANQLPPLYRNAAAEDAPLAADDSDNDTSVIDVIPAKVVGPAIPQVQPARQPAKPFFEFELDDNQDVEVIVKPTPVSPIAELVQMFRSEIPGHKSFKPSDYSAAVVRTLKQCATDCNISETKLVEIVDGIYKDTETSALVKKCGNLGAYLSTAIANRLAAPEPATVQEGVHIHITREMCAELVAGVDPFTPEQRAIVGPKTQMLTQAGDYAGRQIAVDPRFFDSKKEPRYIDNPAADDDCVDCMGTGFGCTSLIDELGNTITLHSDTPCEQCCDQIQSYDPREYADEAAAYAEESPW